MYSFSTCWNSHRHTDGRALLREIRELGFEHAELSHGTRISLMRESWTPWAREKSGFPAFTISVLCPWG